MAVNKLLLNDLKQAMSTKMAFVPPGAPPGAMPPGAPPGMPPGAGAPPGMPPGQPPMDPSMMGGAPPMDPSMMGGAPPMDPSMMGGAPPADPAAQAGGPEAIRSIIQQEIQKAMGGGAATPGQTGPDGKPKGAGKAKVDPAQLIEYMERQQRLLVNLYESLELPLPYNILDKPKDGEQEGQDPASMQGNAQGAGGDSPTQASPQSDASGIPPIKPIEPIGGSKQAAYTLAEKLEAVKYMANAFERTK
jgi:hypothetical protein